MRFENTLGVTRHMRDEALGRLRKDSEPQDRTAVRYWYEGMPFDIDDEMLKEAMVNLMQAPDTDIIHGAVNETRFFYDRAALLMIELAAMWHIDIDSLSADDPDELWRQLEEKHADYTSTEDPLPGLFGLAFADGDDFERSYHCFIDQRDYLTGTLTGWLCERRHFELAAWWLVTRHEALMYDQWPHVTDKRVARLQIKREATNFAAYLGVTSAAMAKRVGALFPYLNGGYVGPDGETKHD